MTDDRDNLWRSHFERSNGLADRAYGDVKPAYELGRDAAANERNRGRSFEDVETDLENGWLNVRTGNGDWRSVREYARHAFESASTGFLPDVRQLGGTASHDRPSFADPVADGIDPTAPDSEEQTFAWQRNDNAPSKWPLGDQGGFGEKHPTEGDDSLPGDAQE